MNARQLAGRLGISPSALAQLERHERYRSISLRSLDRVAEALNCRVEYVLVPLDSLEERVQKQAIHTAERKLARGETPYTPEQISAERELLLNEIANEMANGPSKELWES